MRQQVLLLLTSALFVGFVHEAGASPLTDRVEAAFASTGCAAFADLSPDQSIVALSAWSGREVQQIADEAGLGQQLSDIVGAFYSEKPKPEADVRRLAAGLFAAAPEVADRIAADAAREKGNLCPVLAALFADPLPSVVSNQENLSTFHHPYLKAAQILTDLHGCGPEAADGTFGADSRTAWETLARRLQLGLPKGEFPSPADIARLAAKPKSVGACDTGERAGTAVTALDVIALAATEANWVPVDPARAKLLDKLANEPVLTQYQRRAVAFAVDPSSYRDVGDKAALVEQVYGQGIGVTPNRQAARRWRAIASEADNSLMFYDLYLGALDDGGKAAEAVNAYFGSQEQDSGEESDEGGEVAMTQAGPLRVEYDAEISIGELGELSRLATLVARHPEAMSLILDEGDPVLNVDLATLLLEGGAIDGKNAAAAATLLKSAADDGNAFARSRLAFMHQHGLGVEKDPARSRELALAAAKDDEPFAIYQLARMAEQKGGEAALAEAIGWYEKFLTDPERFQSNYLGTSPMTLLIANRLLEPGEALSSPEGTRALSRIALASPDFARALGDVNLCTTCGGAIDVAQAVKWLRLASEGGSRPAGYTLSRLLKKWPDLASSPQEPLALLRRNVELADDGDGRLFGYNTDTASYFALQAETGPANEDGPAFVRRMAGVLDTLCSKQPDDCENAAHLLASGRLDVRLVAHGIGKLRALNSPYLVDILAQYGDFKGALDLALGFDEHTLDINYTLFAGFVNERSATIRRIIAGRSLEDLFDVPEGLVPLLRFLAAHDDKEAIGFLDILGQKGGAPAQAPRLPTDVLKANFDRVAAFGGLSRTLVNSARELSLALQRDGRGEDALRMELTALSAELQLDDVSGLSAGPLQVSLTRVCHLSKASERAFALGSDHVAIVLAKDAVNTLQKLRADLSNVPEELQACFRDLVADNYRWLADLFIRQGRLGEAEFVLGLLKDFEAFQFVERDGDFAGRSYEELPYSGPEQALRQAFDTLRPPTTLDARRAEELRTKRAASQLTPDEEAELAAIEVRLAEADAAYDDALDLIMAKADDLGRSDRADALASLGPLQGYLQTEVGEPAAALHYLVLPDRLSIVLTTASDRKSFTWTEWEGQPFSEARLDEEVALFHDDLSNPARDPRPRAKRLYDLLLAPFMKDIQAIDTRLVLISLDRRLRYVPFAALFDGERYAAQHFDVAMLSDAGYEISGRKVTGAPVAALGTTQAVAGFAALPGVGIELDGIIKGADGFGLFDGKVELDQDFDRIALEDALRIGAATPAGVGVVHISSHFALGATDATSFLVLGAGDRLNLQEVKRNRRAYDFGRVDLLTLSACATGYADPALDGREMESLSQLTGSRGARAILATLWPVEDNSTAVLMQRFYELRERAGNSKAHALALTQREFIEGNVGSENNLAGQSIVFETAVRGAVPIKPDAAGPQLGLAHPFYWAPFVLTGNWR